jgi:uncharacterized membrane protein
VPRPSSKHRRSLAKAIGWESFSLLLTLVIVYLYTGDMKLTVELAVTCQLIKTFFFYLHERIWHRISWGNETC